MTANALTKYLVLTSDGNVSHERVAAVTNYMQALKNTATVLEDPTFTLPFDLAERYLWIKRVSCDMQAILNAAQDAAWTVMEEVLSSEEATAIIEELRDIAPDMQIPGKEE